MYGNVVLSDITIKHYFDAAIVVCALNAVQWTASQMLGVRSG